LMLMRCQMVWLWWHFIIYSYRLSYRICKVCS
jgi:hypothetical protein